MANVNYIQHLNAVLEQFRKDNRLNPTHISLYLALFQFWNHHRFPELIQVSRDEIMGIAKIGSTTTYHKCIRELDKGGYLKYMPSRNPFKGSKVKMTIFWTSGKQALINSVPKNGQALVPIYKHIQTNKNSYKLPKPKNEKEVLEFFKKEKWPEIEAQKFYNHYQTIGWKIGGKIKIENWHACAKNWMIKHHELSVRKSLIERSRDARTNNNQLSQNQDKFISGAGNLHTKRNKNYNEPL
ncbi:MULTISPECIES: hypothetical protein [Croceibacter]|uniref:hypothetical protein n=1 Tax=Croceibacter TaxID=216431 RepID=UPI000C58C1E8|nr:MULTISPECIES: hypothetical protein [Croceibacter]MBG26343.1 hypothetical protein [Croceibacter sp.]MBW4970875.1 hypothetical protein [Croceibacter atlanticus]|tara:strand:+ start:4744 stop:5463 length:720 start_codon:yes stop_codon:yes gene_type:complete